MICGSFRSWGCYDPGLCRSLWSPVLLNLLRTKHESFQSRCVTHTHVYNTLSTTSVVFQKLQKVKFERAGHKTTVWTITLSLLLLFYSTAQPKKKKENTQECQTDVVTVCCWLFTLLWHVTCPCVLGDVGSWPQHRLLSESLRFPFRHQQVTPRHGRQWAAAELPWAQRGSLWRLLQPGGHAEGWCWSDF